MKHRAARKSFGFPVFQQMPDDLAAVRWGLLAFEPPDTPANDAHPFWAIGPTLDAEPVPDSDTPFLPMLQKTKPRVSGLQLLDDSAVLAIRWHQASVQIRLRSGLLPGETWGISIQLPLDLKLPIQLSSAQSLWDVVRGEPAKNLPPISSRASPNCWWPLTA